MGATTIAIPCRTEHGDFQFFQGTGIDIGCGGELIVPTAQCWDMIDGDARYMQSVPNDSYDFVYSSHCLEHLTNIEESLTNWVRILKPKGFLFIVVPDWLLYEHEVWPAHFNTDHKFTFSLDVQLPRQDHYHIPTRLWPLLESLEIEVIETRLEDWHFDYKELIDEPTHDQSRVALTQIAIIGQKLLL